MNEAFSSVDSAFLPHCSDDHDEWEPVDDNDLEHAEPASAAIEQMVIEPAEPTSQTTLSSSFLNVSDAGVPVVLVFYEERFRIPAEEQSAGRVVDYFYRVEFQERGSPISTAHPVFFPRAITCLFFFIVRAKITNSGWGNDIIPDNKLVEASAAEAVR